MESTQSLVARAFAEALKPDPIILPSQWAADNIIAPDGPYAGKKWDPSITPFLPEILDCMSWEHPCNRVSVRKSAQVGLTFLGIALMGYVVDISPAAAMMVTSTGDVAKQFNREKLQPAIEASPTLAGKVEEQKSRASEGSTGLFKRFPGGFWAISGANSSAALRGKTVQVIYCDEIDDWPLDLDKQGDPMKMVDARQIAFHATGEYKKLEASTPTIQGSSRIDEAFEAGDQRHYQVPCPDCGERQKLSWDNVVFDKTYPHNAHYKCPHCGVLIPHHKKRGMLAQGEWVADVPEPGRHPSFHINALYSPLTTWDKMVEAWLAAESDPTALKTFYNLWLGESYKVQGEAPEAERLFERRSDYQAGRIPAGGLFLTAGVDVQADRLEVEVVAWGLGKTSWSIESLVLEGDTAEQAVWRELRRVKTRSYFDTLGNERRIEMMAVDSGYRTQMVYNFCRTDRQVMAIKGLGSQHAPPIGTPSKQEVTVSGKRRAASIQLWPVGTWQLKAELYGLLNLEGPSESGGYPQGWCFFPKDYDLGFFQQLTSEILVEKQRRGFMVPEWHKNPRVRNEKLDCRIYAMAAGYRLQMGQYTQAQWQRLAAERGAPPPENEMGLLNVMMAAPASQVGPDDEPKPVVAEAAPPPPAAGRTSGPVDVSGFAS